MKKMKKMKIKYVIILIMTLSTICLDSLAQMVGTSGYIKGTSVEIGIDGVGGFEGANRITFPPPAGMHTRTGTNFFGFVANPQVNAWAQFNGDFFTPGSPENGWGIQVGTLQKSNNCSGPLYQIPSGSLNYSHYFDCYDLNWSGAVTSGTTSITASINYHLSQNDLYYITTVSLTNNSTAVIPLMYYYRNIDPDNNQAATPSGGFSTLNTIENQPGTGTGCNDIACVSASQTAPWNSYMALAAIGSDFRVTRGGFSNRSGSDIWNATGSLIGTLGSSANLDEAISLAYRIQNFLPGTTRTFKFVTILRQVDKTIALNNLLSLSYPGSTGSSGLVSACSPTLAPDTVKICGPSTTINVNGPTNGYYAWTWSPTTFLSSSNTYSTVVTPSIQTTYTITGVPTSTCVPPNNVTYTVVVVPSATIAPIAGMLPGSTFFMYVNPTLNKCLGTPLTFSASGGGVGASYVWLGPGGYSSTSQTPTISVSSATNAGTYTVTSVTSLGCTAAATTAVVFIPTPSIAVTPSTTLCQGGVLTHTANAPGAAFYSWSGPASFLAFVPNPTVSTSAMPVNSGVYTVTAYFVVGTSTCSILNTASVTVLPSIPASLGTMTTVCNNGSINLTSPSGGTFYSWTGPNSFLSSVQNPIIPNAGTVNIGVYTVNITTGGCVNTGTINVNVYSPLSYITTPSNITFCAGKSGMLAGSGIGGSNVLNYTWSPSSSSLSAPNSGTTAVTGFSTTTYTLSLTDANCAVTLPVLTTVTVNINPTPIITMTTSNNRGCEPFYTDLIETSAPTSTNCQWRFSNNLGFGNCNAPSYCFPVNGVYGATLTVTDINGCVDSLKNTSFVTVDPNPIADFDWTPNNPNILINEVSFYDQSTVGLPMNNWHWDFGDLFVVDEKDTSNIKNPIHSYGNVYTYSVSLIVTNTFGCNDTVIKTIKVDDDFVIFIPNSFTPHKHDGDNDVFKVSGSGFLSETFEMSIYDRWGSLVYKTNDISKGWDGTTKGGVIAKQETYVYKIKFRDFRRKEKEYVGYISIL